MEAKHTPGPWRIHWGHDTAYPLGISTADRNVVNAFGRPAQDESIANARLIAAAPELLEALEDAINRIKSSLKLLNCDDEFIDREIAKARAAITKATS